MQHEVAVVGAGPSGLATAACLRSHGMTPVVLDRSESLGAVWRSRYDRLHLHTVRWLSGLPGAPIPRAYGRWVSRDDFVAYLETYALRYRVRPRFGVEVERVERDDAGWRLATPDGTVRARRVVIATGYSNVPHLPAWPGRETFPGAFVHSSEYRDPAPYRGKHVLVVGSGNSGAEIAVDLVEAGAERVQLSVRTPPNIIRRDRLGVPSQLIGVAVEPLPPLVIDVHGLLLRRATVPDLTRYGLPAPRRGYSQVLATGTVPILDIGIVDAIRSGRVGVVPGVDGFDAGEVVLTSGARAQPDAIVAATGFRPGLERLVGHLGVLDEHGIPVAQGPRTSPGAPDLYFVAVSLAIGGLIRRAARQAQAVARAIAA